MPKNKNKEEEKEESFLEESSEDEESELVEILEEEKQNNRLSGQIDEVKFKEFFNPVSSSSPVLEEVTAEQESPIFISSFSQGSDTRERREEDSTGYLNQKQYNDEPKYVDTPGIDNEFSRINTETTGRDLHPQLRNVAPVTFGIHELNNSPKNKKEDYLVSPKQIDEMEIGRERPKPREYKIGETPV
jgi:hypothetical protein